MKDAVTDRTHLTTHSYATADPLTVRIETHRLYTRPEVDFTSWVLDHLDWRGDEQLLDIGCGAGEYIQPVCRRLSRGGFMAEADLSLGMLRDASGRVGPAAAAPVNADAMCLPFATHSFDVVLANHMLYHVPDIPAAVSEIWRVLRPGGFLIAATNDSESMRRLFDELSVACASLGAPIQIPISAARTRFNLDNGADSLRPCFDRVVMDRLTSELVFPDSAPVVRYINSMRDFYEHQIPAGIAWEQLMAAVEEQVQRVIRKEGIYRVSKDTGVLVAAR